MPLIRARSAEGRSFRHDYTAEERDRITGSLFFQRDPRWRFRFAFFIALSVTIATMGLLADSAAVVIGAMLVAPLMTPVLALAYCVAVGWGERAIAAGSTVILGAAGSIGIAYILAWLVPLTSNVPTQQVLSRTSPDMRDLIVALAAGAAGTYATLRDDGSAALPGVAVAVALVPPLATVGITLQLGRFDLAPGALLLFLANLFAILAAGMMTFLISGFVSWSRATKRGGFFLRAVIPIVLTAVIAVPLWSQLTDAARATQREQREAESERRIAELDNAVENTVKDWLAGSEGDLELDAVRFSEDRSVLTVDLIGSSADTPPIAELEGRLALLPEVGQVQVLARSTSRSAVRQDVEPAPPSDEERLVAQIEGLARAWVAELSSEDEYRLSSVALVDGEAEVTIVGTALLPDASGLAQLILDETGQPSIVLFRQRLPTEPPPEPEPEPEAAPPSEGELAERAAQEWASTRDVDVLAVNALANEIVIDLTAEVAPDGDAVRSLVDDVRAALDVDEADVRVRFVERVTLEPTPQEADPDETDGDDGLPDEEGE